ncbi:MAG TPA: O-antigen ligase family protein [Bacillota bacterium]
MKAYGFVKGRVVTFKIPLQSQTIRLIRNSRTYCRLIKSKKQFSKTIALIKTVWGSSFDRSYLKTAFSKLGRIGIELFPQLISAVAVNPRRKPLLEGVLLLQLVTAPVIPFSLPLLAATVILMALLTAPGKYPVDRHGKGLPGLELAATLAVSALLTSDFQWRDPVFWEWEGQILLSWLAGNCLSKEFSKKLLLYLVFTSVIWLIIGFGQIWAGVPTPPGWLGFDQANLISVRSYAVFGNPNIYALYLLSITGLIIGLIRSGSVTVPVRNLAWLILILAQIALYLTYSRTGWLLAAGLLGYWLATAKVTWSGWLLYGSIGIFLVTMTGFRARIFNLLALTDSSTGYRWRIWQGVAEALREHWFWGTGPGSFFRIYPWFQVKVTPSQHAHSFYLQFWLEYGLVGLLAWLSFGRKMIHRIRKGGRESQTAGIAWLVFWGGGLTESWQVNRFCSGYFWLLTGILLALSKKEFAGYD